DAVRNYHVEGVSAEISLDNQLRDKGAHDHEPHYEFLMGLGLRQLERGDFERIVLESDTDVLRRIARNLLSRKKRQDLSALLREVGDALEPTMAGHTADDIDLLQATRNALDDQERLASDLAKALLESGTLDQALKQATEIRADEYISSQATTLRAGI